jgi:hypothetical protein
MIFLMQNGYSRPGAETGDVKYIWDNIFPEAYRPACRLRRLVDLRPRLA